MALTYFFPMFSFSNFKNNQTLSHILLFINKSPFSCFRHHLSLCIAMRKQQPIKLGFVLFKSFQMQSVFVWKLLAQTGTDLSTQNCYKPVETALLQLDVHNNLSTSCSNKHGTACYHQSWYKLFQQLATGLQANNLSTSCWRQLATTCWLNKLVATCSTSCYKLVKPTTCWQDVRFYVCNIDFPSVEQVFNKMRTIITRANESKRTLLRLPTQKRTTCNKPAADL